jgi:PAS domain S-box-containing protein
MATDAGGFSREELAEAVDATTARFEEVIRNARHILYRQNVKAGGYDYLSPYAEALTGHPLDELKRITLGDLPAMLHPEDRERIFGEGGALARAIARRDGSKAPFTVEYRFRKADGDYCWLLDQSTILFDEQGDPEAIIGSAYNIDELKRSEELLKASAEKFRTLVECSIDVIFVLDSSGVFQFVSPSWETHFGYPTSDVIGRNFSPFVHPDDVQPCLDYLIRVLTTGCAATSPPYRVRHADGTWRLFTANGSTYADSNGMVFFVGIGRDLSAQKQAEDERLNLERQLLHAQKLESLGVLAGGIAHDFNNILTAIIGNADLALMRLNPESPVLENLQRIEKAAARAADLARQMLAYSGKGMFVIESIDLNRLVEEMGHMLTVSISKKALLSYNLTHPLSAVEVDATQIRQIIMNLVINASEAIGDDNGVIAISTGCMECDQKSLKELWLNDSIPAGEYVFLEVADSGCGMDEDTLTKIFDPFFTTKFTGRGLGMAAVLGIVRGHKGAIKVWSEPGKGSSFKVLLPAGSRHAEQPVGTHGAEVWRGSGVALLVDDEETVRSIGGEMLQELGFEVVTASDGREALERFKDRPDITIVILDLTMPRMGGDQCFRELMTLGPNLSVIMSTGFSEQEIAQKFAGMGLAGFVQKPYKLSVLRDALRKIQSV